MHAPLAAKLYRLPLGLLLGVAVAAGWVCGGERNAFGQSTAPPAATRPVPAAATPREALRSLATALAHADGAGLLDVVHAPTEPERRFIAALTANLAATARMRAAVVKAFGESAAERFGNDPAAALAEALRQIDQTQNTTDGNRSVVRYANGQVFTLVRTASGWQVPLSQFPGAATPDTADAAATELFATARVADAVAADVAVGRHKSADAAWQAWRGRLASAMGGGKKAAVRPATTQSVR